MITQQHRQEDLSRSYMQAVAAEAKIIISFERSHDYGIDGSFKQVSFVNEYRKESGFSIDFQLKASQNVKIANGQLSYVLDASTYNHLVTRSKNNGIPCMLIVLALPKNSEDWVSLTHSRLTLKHCCYYEFVSGDQTTNKNSKTIQISLSNLLTPDKVIFFLERLANGEFCYE